MGAGEYLEIYIDDDGQIIWSEPENTGWVE